MLGPDCTHQLQRFSSSFKLDQFCAIILLSKIVGLLMTIAGFFYKVPVIANIWSRRTGAGLSIFTLYLETVSYMARVVYNVLKGHTLTTYGDYVFSTCQQFIIVVLVWRLGTGEEKKCSSFHILMAISVAVSLVAVMVSLPPERHFLIALCSLIISLFSKLPQIVANFKYKKVGVQSTTTLWNGVSTAAAKVFVCLVETGDALMVLSGAISFVLNSVLLIQVISYRKHDEQSALAKCGDTDNMAAAAAAAATVTASKEIRSYSDATKDRTAKNKTKSKKKLP